MRKIKLLLASVLAMTAWTGVMADVTQPTLTTDPSNPALYTIKSLRTGKYATYTGASTQLSQEVNISKASLWFFEENGEGVSIIPAKDPSVKLVNHSSATETGAVWYLVENPYRAGYFCVTLSNNASSNCWDDQGNQTKIGFWQPSESDNQGTSWIIEPFDLNNPVEVTYEIYDGETMLSSTTVLQEANSEVAIPANLTGMIYNGGYQPKAYYTFTPEGTIGEQDCTIKVTRTATPGVVHALTELSNEKAYTIRCDRGGLLTNGTTIASTSHSSHHNDATANFAILLYEDNYYIYSVADKKFVQNNGSLAEMPTNGVYDAIQMEAKDDPYFLFTFKVMIEGEEKAQGLNTNGTGKLDGCVIDGWTNPDQGDQYYMIEAADFDATEALAALENYFHPSYYLTYVIKDPEGNILATYADVPATPGAHITTLPADYTKPFCTYNTVDVTVTEQYTTVEFTATWDGPITLANGYDNITWQNIYINRGEDNHWYLANGETLPTFVKNPTEKQRASEYYQWGFVGNVYQGVMIYNKATGSTKTLNSSSTVAMVEGEFVFDQFVNYNGGILIGKGGQYLNQSGGATSTKLGTWGSTTDQGSTLYVSEVPDIPVTTVYFDYTYNGRVVNTVSVPGLAVGDPVPEVPTTIPDFTTIDAPSVEGMTVTENLRISVPATWDGPFDLATDFASAHWYDMSIRATWYVTSDKKDEDGALKTVNADAIGLGEDAYQWAFVGDPWHVYLFNKAEGDTKVYAWTSTGNASIPAFVDAETGNYWQIRKSTASGDAYANAFMLTIPGMGYQVNQFGGAGGSLKIWTSTGTGDIGSAFKVFDVPSNFASYVVEEGIADAYEATGYFAFTDAAKAALSWDPTYKTDCPFETYKSLKKTLASATSDITNFVLPETGVYFLKNKNYEKGLMGIDPSDANMYGDYAAIKDARNYVTLIKTGAATYKISLMGKYAPATVEESTPVVASTEAGEYTVVITKPGYAAFQADTEVNMSCLHRRSQGDIVGWEPTADASMWAVTKATGIELTVGEAGYATAYLPFPVKPGQTISVPAAIGTWTFDDGTTGSLVATAGVTVADGVATVPVGDNLAMATGAEELGTYTFMMDVKISNEDNGRYTSLFMSGSNREDGGLFFYNHKTNGRRIGINLGGMGYDGSYDIETWYRVVFSCENYIPTVYVNGVKVAAAAQAVHPTRLHWTLSDVVYFFADNDGEENLVQTDEIRFWDVALSEAEVGMLGAYGDVVPDPTTVTAYTAVINKTWLDLVPVEGIIPAYTAVILKGDAATYNFAIPAINEEGGDVPEGDLPIFEEEMEGSKALVKSYTGPLNEEDNVLKGTLEPIDAAGKYVLAKPEGEEVGFYLADRGTIAATKAYLELNDNTGSLVKAFYFAGEGATAIKTIDNGQQTTDGPIYNIAGQRLGKMQKGINIVNGKKIAIK